MAGRKGSLVIGMVRDTTPLPGKFTVEQLVEQKSRLDEALAAAQSAEQTLNGMRAAIRRDEGSFQVWNAKGELFDINELKLVTIAGKPVKKAKGEQ